MHVSVCVCVCVRARMPVGTCTHRVFVCEHTCRLNMVHIRAWRVVCTECAGCVHVLRQCVDTNVSVEALSTCIDFV